MKTYMRIEREDHADKIELGDDVKCIFICFDEGTEDYWDVSAHTPNSLHPRGFCTIACLPSSKVVMERVGEKEGFTEVGKHYVRIKVVKQ